MQTNVIPLELPWRLTCKIACRALIDRRTFDDQVDAMTQEGMVRHEMLRARYNQMRRSNRTSNPDLELVEV